MVGVILFFKMSKIGNIVKKLKNHCPIVLRDNVNTVVGTYSILEVHILKGLWGLIHNLTTPIS